LGEVTELVAAIKLTDGQAVFALSNYPQIPNQSPRFFYDDLDTPLNPDSLLATMRSLVTLFRIGIDKKRFYTFMASSHYPGKSIGRRLGDFTLA
jgi:hypothetical protein